MVGSPVVFLAVFLIVPDHPGGDAFKSGFTGEQGFFEPLPLLLAQTCGLACIGPAYLRAATPAWIQQKELDGSVAK